MVWPSDQDASQSPDGPRTRFRDNMSLLAWEHLGIQQQELKTFDGESDVLVFLLDLLLLRLDLG